MPLQLSDQDVETIKRDIEDGARGPVLLKWIRQLLEDRAELRRRLREAGRDPDDL